MFYLQTSAFEVEIDVAAIIRALALVILLVG